MTFPITDGLYFRIEIMFFTLKKIIKINKDFPVLLNNTSKIVFFKIHFYAPGIKYGTVLENKENKNRKE